MSFLKISVFSPFNKTAVLWVILFVLGYSSHCQEVVNETVRIPEPLMFDLVRGLGAKQGELEINSLADFPLNKTSSRKVEWAPEIEYAMFDGFAVELEFPMENFELEAFKAAIQWTIGASKNNQFIHGIQVIAEQYIHDDILELNFLYVPAYRFNEVWSAIGLFGVMIETGKDAARKKNTIVLNASLFADVNEHTVVGLELNNTNPMIQKIDSNDMELLVLPQVHYEFGSGFATQLGFGPKFAKGSTPEASAVLRVIKSF
ncbi:hypothetical protein KFZ70_07380 [Tamlana fucoidanivorans]|uniref:Phosphoribosylformylglycinamidine synthase n=1 Tax=Allotamlana fucoidanivorans TaxID=2583814 RepID=A0A5C4SL46_9FLAO|nr:hypothetical protein [Tamlana fucoidanivorans]TNJ43847.1 hypothetical protein FGF67_10815 [Tamlana fucoidanivorans]